MAVTAANYDNIHTTTYRDRILNSTAEEIAVVATTVFAVELDNSANTADSYAKFYDVSSAPSIGTTNPGTVIRVPASTKILVVFNQGILLTGTVFGTGLFVVGVTTKGTDGSTSPASDFLATLYTT